MDGWKTFVVGCVGAALVLDVAETLPVPSASLPQTAVIATDERLAQFHAPEFSARHGLEERSRLAEREARSSGPQILTFSLQPDDPRRFYSRNHPAHMSGGTVCPV